MLQFIFTHPFICQSFSSHQRSRDILFGGKSGNPVYTKLFYFYRKRGRKQEKGGKGLRHFSMKVCEKVQKKVVTSYNEVADELVMEFSDPRNITPTDQVYIDNK